MARGRRSGASAPLAPGRRGVAGGWRGVRPDRRTRQGWRVQKTRLLDLLYPFFFRSILMLISAEGSVSANLCAGQIFSLV